MKMKDIKFLMKITGCSYSDIAETLGVHKQTVYNWVQNYTPEHHMIILDAISELTGGGTHDEVH